MKAFTKHFNMNWITVGLLTGAFVFSAVRFFHVSRTAGGEELGDKVIRVAHWQLEPGFREALQWAIDEYNALPKVQEAGLTVIQAPISERVYNQFMNVHLISGTAPDIAVKKESTLVKGNALAKFYAPLGVYVDKPNPYNATEYQVEDLPEDLAEYLLDSPWRDTFFDGLEGGYENELSDFYAIPICTWGGTRMIYNRSVLEATKAFAREASQQSPQPDWLQAIWRTDANSKGYLEEAEGIAWLEDDSIPQTLGQLMLYCHAIEPYRISAGIDYLVPIAGSSYSANDVSELYQAEFMSAFWKKLSLESGKSLSSLEALAGFNRGVWSFQSLAVREYFEFSRQVAGFFPEGYLGLDREQAQRRFVLGQAAILSTGGWDATSIYRGSKAARTPATDSRSRSPLNPCPGKESAGQRCLPCARRRPTRRGGCAICGEQTVGAFRLGGRLSSIHFITPD